ncbi:MAG TPA: tetratricopeptide repeat protein [Chitinophagaceae bacterium]|nr:tetratricopeptide repeat protein [Chitinophagaceae bacterium]
MKQTFTYLAIVAIFITAVGFIIVKYNHDEQQKANAVYGVKERRGAQAQTAEWVSTRTTANNLLNAIKQNPDDSKSKLELASLFIQEARVTGDYFYYDAAAMKYVNDVLKKDPAHFEALIYKAIIQLSQHHFAEGLATAARAQTINPYNAFVYGIMVDANVELGNYAAAVAHADKMVSIRPDLRSYSRIAYLREIHGDIPGAIEAMKMAIEAGMPGHESTEWCRAQLGQLYEQSGDTRSAETQYSISLEERPAYAYALAGMARIAAFNKNYEQALGHYRQAYDMINDYAFKENMVEIYRLQGKQQAADKLAKEMIEEMQQVSANIGEDSAGHYSDRELAYAYLAVNNTNKALEHARLEYNRRPANMDVNETIAWVYYKQNAPDKALPHIKMALQTNSKNPTLLARAGLIYYQAGDKVKAMQLLQQALQQKPVLSPVLQQECISTLQTLQKG